MSSKHKYDIGDVVKVRQGDSIVQLITAAQLYYAYDGKNYADNVLDYVKTLKGKIDTIGKVRAIISTGKGVVYQLEDDDCLYIEDMLTDCENGEGK